MAKRIAKSTLNASTIDILNVIRNYSSYNYQQSIPVIQTERDIPAVGEIIVGTPALANEFLEALINRIALTIVKSATFNNPYSFLKKGYLEFGESVEDIFVEIAKVVNYDPNGARREFQKTKPDVRSAFYVRNYQVMYPVTIEDEELRTAFLSVEGVQDLISRIVDQIYTAAEYDEFLIFKKIIIDAVCDGRMFPVEVGTGSETEIAVELRAMSSKLTFMSDKYNIAHVKTTCPRERQVIFMTADDEARFDVDVLAAAFNMSKADFLSRVVIVDDFTSFDNDRFAQIMDSTDSFERVTDAELEAMKTVKAVLVDEQWFQIYDNLSKFTEKYVASSLYWNYFYHTWKTIATSPFSDACVFITDAVTPYDTLTFHIADISKDTKDGYEYAVINLAADADTWKKNGFQNYRFIQSQECTDKVVGVEPYGSYMFEKSILENGDIISVTPYMICDDVTYKGDKEISTELHTGDTITFTVSDDIVPYSGTKKKTKKNAKENTVKDSATADS